MKIHEYQAKELLAAAGAPIPKGIVVRTPEEATQAFDTLGGPVVIKAQIHAGGRGKGGFKGSGFHPGSYEGDGPKLGGVKFIAKREEIAPVAEVYFRYPLVTLQTGEEGQKVSKALVVEAKDKIVKEYYLGMVLDRAVGLPVLMASAEGGMDIEEVAAKHPEKILKLHVDPLVGLHAYQARDLALRLGFTGDQVTQAADIMVALTKVFLEKEASLVEINPLGVMDNGKVLVIDAKIDLDDNALFRHPELQALRDETEENPAERRASQAGLTYIALDGNIGCLVNGAGLAMATMDIIKYHGGNPANFLDVGGGVTAAGAIEAFRIILSDPKVKGVLVNVFGGIASCATIAEALVQAGREVGFKVPVVVRLEGNKVEEARQILTAAQKELPTMQTATDLTDAARKVVAAAGK
ncbi:MAG: ADP-forming succinate--CoA ligase subunit beta [Gemmataceae bacterium]